METVELGARVKLDKGEVMIPEGLARELKAELKKRRTERLKKEQSAEKEGKKLRRVVLDPGHGGKFPGACAHGIEEKDINLDVCLYVKTMLEEEGIEVLMTRARDVELSQDLSTDLDLRCDFANSKKADIFVSVHANAGADYATGFEVFVTKPEFKLDIKAEKGARESPITGDEVGGEARTGTALSEIVWQTLLKEYYDQSVELAQKICEGLDETIPDDNRGVNNEHDFRVTTWTRCPAVLVEMGYMTHRATAQKLKTRTYLKAIAKGIAQGILEFKKEFDETNGFTKPAENKTR
jgi:N-acetylmuramoyl-L-alanine amidase